MLWLLKLLKLATTKKKKEKTNKQWNLQSEKINKNSNKQTDYEDEDNKRSIY